MATSGRRCFLGFTPEIIYQSFSSNFSIIYFLSNFSIIYLISNFSILHFLSNFSFLQFLSGSSLIYLISDHSFIYLIDFSLIYLISDHSFIYLMSNFSFFQSSAPSSIIDCEAEKRGVSAGGAVEIFGGISVEDPSLFAVSKSATFFLVGVVSSPRSRMSSFKHSSKEWTLFSGSKSGSACSSNSWQMSKRLGRLKEQKSCSSLLHSDSQSNTLRFSENMLSYRMTLRINKQYDKPKGAQIDLNILLGSIQDNSLIKFKFLGQRPTN